WRGPWPPTLRYARISCILQESKICLLVHRLRYTNAYVTLHDPGPGREKGIGSPRADDGTDSKLQEHPTRAPAARSGVPPRAPEGSARASHGRRRRRRARNPGDLRQRNDRLSGIGGTDREESQKPAPDARALQQPESG